MKTFTSLFFLLHICLILESQTFHKRNNPEFSSQRYHSNSASWGDFDNDGDLDLFITNGERGQPNEFYVNEGAGHFMAVSNILTDKDVPSFSSAWGDYDNDGWLDLYVANCQYAGNPKGIKNFLFKNNGDGTFTKITDNAIVSHEDPSYACSWADYDNDGWLDLYVVNAYQRRNRLYHNNGDGSFSEITNDPAVTDLKHEISCSWSDYDNDGDVDLLVINTDEDRRSSMFTNNGDGSFSNLYNEVTSKKFYKCRGSNWGDYNNDGWMDLLMIDSQGGNNILFRNNGDGSFTEISSPDFISSKHHSGNASQWGDFDNDGYLDMILMHHRGILPEFHRNNGAGGFDKIENEWTRPNVGYAWSLTAVDVNLDGYLDIFQANRFSGYDYDEGLAEKNMLFLNTTTGCDPFSLISLRGIESNFYGLGARVQVYGTNSDGTTLLQKREMACLSGGGYTAQNGNTLHFGLADWEQIDSIIVLWPSGIKTQYDNLPVNRHFELYENEEIEYLDTQNELSITTVRDESCPHNIQQLVVNNAHNKVTWYKDGAVISNQDTINISFDQNEILYMVEDGQCGDKISYTVNNQHLEWLMFPNPANKFVKFRITNNPIQYDALVNLYDITGKFVMRYEISLAEGYTEKQFPVINLASGTYIAVIEAGCWQSVEKLVVITGD